MEPGHEDREYVEHGAEITMFLAASMEPGHEDREYQTPVGDQIRRRGASMEPGHEDREYPRRSRNSCSPTRRLNGARS